MKLINFLFSLLIINTVTADVLIPNFRKSIVWKDLEDPVAIRFASTGKVYIALKGGKVLLVNSIHEHIESSANYKELIDLSEETFDWWDRGLSGIALHPEFPNTPYIYLWYSADVTRNDTLYTNQTTPIYNDACPSRLCSTRGRLTRLTTDSTGSEVLKTELLLEIACSYSPSHHTGNALFGPDGDLYISIGDGSLIDGAIDVGDDCRCPSGECEGSFRSQNSSLIHGKLLRIDREALERPALTDQDTILFSDIHIVAKGFRNVYRFMFDPYNNDVYLGDVGAATYEEINRVRNVTNHSQPEKNFGWPCYEGPYPNAAYAALGSPICAQNFGDQEAFFPYRHDEEINPDSPCATGTSAVTGMLIYSGTRFPNIYQKGLLFADFARRCGWFFFRDDSGEIQTSTIQTFWSEEPHVVDLQLGPDGAVYMVQVFSGIISKIQYIDENSPPEAIISADKLDGPTPLSVVLNASDSYSFQSTIVSYSWDIDNDGKFGDRNTTTVTLEFLEPGVYPVSLFVVDAKGRNASTSVSITAAYQINFEFEIWVNGKKVNHSDTSVNTKDVGVWKVNDSLVFSFNAYDQNFLQVPSSNLSWSIRTPHCYLGTCGAEDSCHEHKLQSGKTGNGTFVAQPHEWPSYLVFHLEAVHPLVALKRESTVPLWPLTTEITFTSQPTGFILDSDGVELVTPFQKRLIPGVRTQITVTQLQILGHTPYNFTGWNVTGSQQYNKSVTYVPSPGETVVVTFATTTVNAVQTISQPQNLTATAGYKSMTLNWVSPAINSSILYYRLYWSLTNDSSISKERTLEPSTVEIILSGLEWNSEYNFSLSAITAQGEGNSASVIASTLRIPPAGFSDPCVTIEYVCDLYDIVVNDYNTETAWYEAHNLLSMASDTDGTMNSFKWETGGYSVFSPRVDSYYYEVLASSTQCFNATIFNTLVIRFRGPIGSRFSVSISDKNSDCYTKNTTVKIEMTDYILPNNDYQEARIPLSAFEGINLARLSSILLNNFAPYRSYRLDAIYFTQCADSLVKFQTKVINDFSTAISTNNFNLSTSVSGFTSKYAIENGQLVLIPGIFSSGFSWKTSLAEGNACYDASSWKSLQIAVQAPYDSAFTVTLTSSAACTNTTEISFGVDASSYGVLDSTNTIITIPLSEFSGLDTGHLSSISLSSFSPADTTFTLSFLRFTAAEGKKISVVTTSWLSCTSDLVVDKFMDTKSTNDLGFATNVDATMDMWVIDTPGRLVLSTGNKSGSYFYTLLSDKSCFNALSYRYLELVITAPAETSFLVRLSPLLSDCVTRDQTIDASVSISKYITFDGTKKTISIPLDDFPNANLSRIGAVTFGGFPTGRNTTLAVHGIKLTCNKFTVYTPDCTNVSSVLIADFPRTNNLNDLGGETSAGDSMTASVVDGTLTLTGTGYWYTVLPSCINTSKYQYLQIDLAAPSDASFSITAAQKYANCSAKDPSKSAKLHITDYVNLNPTMQRISIPLVDFSTVDQNLFDSFTLSDFSGNFSTKVDMMRFTCGTQPPRNSFGTCENAENWILIDDFTTPRGNYLDEVRPDMSSDLVAQYDSVNGGLFLASTTSGKYFMEEFASPRDFSTFYFLKFELSAPPDSRLQLQVRSWESGNAIDSNPIIISNYVKFNNLTMVVVIPLSDVTKVNWSNVTRISFGDFTPNVTYYFKSLSLLCTDVSPLTEQTSCSSYTIADFSKGNASLTDNAIGGDTSDDGTMAWITVNNDGKMAFQSIGGVSYWYTDFTTGGCLDGRKFNALIFELQAPVNTEFDIRVMQKGPDCVRRDSWVDLPLSNFVTPDGTVQEVVVPVSSMLGINTKLLHAMALVNFRGNYSVTIDNIHWGCVSSSSCSGLKVIDYTLGGIAGINLFGEENGNENLQDVAIISQKLRIVTGAVSGGYWYADLGCLDLSDYRSLQLVIRAPRNISFKARFNLRDAACSGIDSYSDSVVVSGFNGNTQVMTVPLINFGTNLVRVGSLVLHSFGSENITLYLESISICGYTPSCSSFSTVNDFLTSTSINNLGLNMTSVNGMTATWLGEKQLILSSTSTISSWITQLAQPNKCFNGVSFEALAVEIKGVPLTSVGVTIGQKTSDCTGSAGNATLLTSRYITFDGSTQLLRIPLTEFAVNLSRLDFIGFTNFDGSVQISKISFCSLTRSVLPTPSVTPSISVSPSRSASPSITPSKSASPSVTPSRSKSPSVTPSVSVSPSRTPSPSSSASISPSSSPSSSNTPSPSPSSTASVTSSPSATPSPSSSRTPSLTPSPSPSMSSTPSSSVTPSCSSSTSISPSPSLTPSVSPSASRATGDGTAAIIILTGNIDDFDQELFIEQLAELLNICACRIVIVNVSVRKDNTAQILVTIQVLEKSGEEQSTTVLQNLQQQVDVGTVVLGGLTAQSVQVLSDNNSQAINKEGSHKTVIIAIAVVVGVFGVVTAISIGAALMIISKKKKNVVHPAQKATLQQHKDPLVQTETPKIPKPLPIDPEKKLSRYLHSSFSAQPLQPGLTVPQKNPDKL